MVITEQTREHKIAAVFAAILILLGTLVIAGWLGGFFAVTTLLEGRPSMEGNTALGILGLGVSLWGIAHFKSNLIPGIVGLFILILGGITLAQYIFEVNLWIDQAIFSSTGRTEYPGRMSIATATSFVGCGLLILGLYDGPRRYPALFDTIFIITVFLPMTAAMAYIYSPGTILTVKAFSTMAVHTAAGFLLFLIGIALLVRDRSILRFFSVNSIVTSIYGPLIVLPLAIGWAIERMITLDIMSESFAIALGATGFVIIINLFMAWISNSKEQAGKRLDQEKKNRISTEQRLLDLLDQSNDAILLFGPKQEVLHANSGAVKLLGWSAQEIKSLSLPDLIPQRFRERHATLVTGFHKKKTTGSLNDDLLKMIALHREGYEIPVSIAISKQEVDGEIFSTAVVRDSRALVKTMGDLQDAAFIDSLTQVNNRRALDKVLEDYRGGKRTADQTAILMIDLDHFKYINDTYGHDCGDDILRQVAQSISGCLREEDKVFRFGGDEFVVILWNISIEKALALGERIRHATSTIKSLNEDEYAITLSVGVALSESNENSLEDTFKRADTALYNAKNKGRNQTVGSVEKR